MNESEKKQYGEDGFRKLIVWKNAYELRKKIYEITKKFPRNEMRRISQMRDAARSVKQNIQEGYLKSTKEYIHSLEISRGSLAELLGDIDDCRDDLLIEISNFVELHSLCKRTGYLFHRLIQSLRRKTKPSISSLKV